MITNTYYSQEVHGPYKRSEVFVIPIDEMGKSVTDPRPAVPRSTQAEQWECFGTDSDLGDDGLQR